MSEVRTKISRGAQIIIGALFFLSDCDSVVAGGIMVLSYQSLKKVMSGVSPMIHFPEHLVEKCLQPASLDIPLSDRCYRVSVSALPNNGHTMTELLKRFTMYDFELKKEGGLLEKGMTYVLPLSVSLSLSEQFRALFSSKSTTGRNDVFARAETEDGKAFDMTVFGYEGQLYLEATPLSFHTMVYPFESLTQMRLTTTDDDCLSDDELAVLHSQYGIVRDQNGDVTNATIKNNSLYLHLDLSNGAQTAGYESLKSPEGYIHLGSKEVDAKEEFWRRIKPTSHGDLILHPDSFYLLSTRERIVIPPNVCATMQEYSVGMGEFRSHYAGFFDNGFGGEKGTQGVLEFRARDLPVRFSDNQRICRLVFYRTDEVPEKIYGKGSHYTGSGPRMAKNFINYLDW
jgi:dCTP deaminase